MPGVFIPAAVFQRLCVPLLRCEGVLPNLLLWGMQCIRKKNTEPIVLHVAEWNKNALLLYKKNGFEITNIEKIR